MIENTTMKSNFLVDRRMIHKNTHSRMMQASRNMVYFFILSSVSFRYRKYSESRAQKKKNSFIFLVPRRLLYYPNMSESRAQKKAERRRKRIHSFFLCRGASRIVQIVKKAMWMCVCLRAFSFGYIAAGMRVGRRRDLKCHFV